MAEDLTICGGRIIRPGFYRRPDGSGVHYARQIADSDVSDCVFCPELDQTITYEGDGFTVVEATPKYAHFDAQEVVTHELLIPEPHINSLRALGKRARRRIDEFIHDYEDGTPEHLRFQDYTRREGNPSKSVEHLHIHLLRLTLRPIRRFSFDASLGVTALDFSDLTPEQIIEINRSRTRS